MYAASLLRDSLRRQDTLQWEAEAARDKSSAYNFAETAAAAHPSSTPAKLNASRHPLAALAVVRTVIQNELRETEKLDTHTTMTEDA